MWWSLEDPTCAHQGCASEPPTGSLPLQMPGSDRTPETGRGTVCFETSTGVLAHSPADHDLSLVAHRTVPGSLPRTVRDTHPGGPEPLREPVIIPILQKRKPRLSKWWSQDSPPGSVRLAASQGGGQQETRLGPPRPTQLPRRLRLSPARTQTAGTEMTWRQRTLPAGFHRSCVGNSTKELNTWAGLYPSANGLSSPSLQN